jgi:hypothetical protein
LLVRDALLWHALLRPAPSRGPGRVRKWSWLGQVHGQAGKLPCWRRSGLRLRRGDLPERLPSPEGGRPDRFDGRLPGLGERANQLWSDDLRSFASMRPTRYSLWNTACLHAGPRRWTVPGRIRLLSNRHQQARLQVRLRASVTLLPGRAHQLPRAAHLPVPSAHRLLLRGHQHGTHGRLQRRPLTAGSGRGRGPPLGAERKELYRVPRIDPAALCALLAGSGEIAAGRPDSTP